jgi:hypothetical protein
MRNGNAALFNYIDVVEVCKGGGERERSRKDAIFFKKAETFGKRKENGALG